MSPKNAWMAFSMLVIFAVILAVIVLEELGISSMVAYSIGPVFLLVYFYVLYKRYNVEVASESDIESFTDPDDLRILCRIYGLDGAGDEGELRERLKAFSRANSSHPFAWIAPRLVRSVGSALEVPEPVRSQGAQAEGRPLTRGITRPDSRQTPIDRCPVCDAELPGRGTVCEGCGADLGFYAVLRGSKVGRRLVSEKSRAVRRKLRYDVPALGERK